MSYATERAVHREFAVITEKGIHAMAMFVLIALLLAGFLANEIIFARSKGPKRVRNYERSLYACAVLLGLFPLVTPAWGWSLLWLPGALWAAKLVVDDRRKKRQSRKDDSVGRIG